MRAKLSVGTGALVVALVGLWVAAVAVPAKPRGRCDRHPAYRQDSVTRVFRVHTRHYFKYSYALTVYYACARPNGRAVQLALDDVSWNPGSTYGDYVLASLRLAARYVGALVVRDAGSATNCVHAEQPVCPTPYVELAFVEARSRTKAQVSAPNGTKGLTLSAAGAAAWLVPASSGGVQLMASGLNPQGGQLKISPQLLDTGSITELRFHGRTLSWRNGGTPRSATLS